MFIKSSSNIFEADIERVFHSLDLQEKSPTHCSQELDTEGLSTQWDNVHWGGISKAQQHVAH